MQHRIRDYVLSLIAVVAAYAMYALIAVPLLEPAAPKKMVRDHGGSNVSPSRRNPFAHLFQPGDWEIDNPKILETSQGTLLFHDYRPLAEGRLEIRPCTLIVFSAESEAGTQLEQSARPIVLQAKQGAILQFDEEVDLTRGQVGKLVGGRILGDVRVFAPESAPQAGDALELVTRNLQIERTKAWTPHDVKFQYGPSHGSGRDLVLNLAPAEAVSNAKTKAAALGKVESLQLTHVEEIHLEQNGRGMLPDSGKPAAVQPPVKITCEGPFRFDVAKRMATFDENVTVLRLVPVAKPDRLRCKQLAVFLAPPSSADKAKPTGADPVAATGNIERIVAVGNPVTLDSPSQGAYTEAARLEYNLQTKQMLLQSLNSGAKVLLRRANDEFTAPELHYEVMEGKQLGRMWAPGPGRLVSRLDSGTQARAFSAEWKKEIRIRPHEANQVISLTEAAKVVVENQGSFTADEIHFWVIELPTSKVSSQNLSHNPLAGKIIPDRLLATGHVHADSPQLSADMERLETWFEQVPGELPQPVKEAPPAPNSELILQPAAGPAPRSEPRQPLVRIKEPLTDSPTEAATNTPPPHFHVVGEVVRMLVQQNGKLNEIRELSVEGPRVRVAETNARQDVEPFALAGTRIDMEEGLGPMSIATVFGEPAMVSARGLTLTSSALKLNRRDNRVLVEQAGEMQLPVQQDFSGQELAEPRPLKITWSGSLVFDGSVAKFRREVVARGPDYWAKADELQATLTSRIDFGKSNTGGKKPELKRLQLAGGEVELEHRAYTAEGRQQSVEHMNLKSLDLDRLSGDLYGAGPGWVRSVRLGSAPGLGTPAVPPIEKKADDDGITYLKVDFQREMQGNLHRHEIAFTNQVQAIHGPVEHWDAIIEPTRREQLGQQGAILNADQLVVNEFIPRGAKHGPIELRAVGNTRVEGRDFDAKANRLTYTTAKSQLVLEGDGRQDAEIFDHVRKGSTTAGRILFWTDTNTVQVDDARNLTIGPVGSKPTPKPPSPRDLPLRK